MSANTLLHCANCCLVAISIATVAVLRTEYSTALSWDSVAYQYLLLLLLLLLLLPAGVPP
jgi:hypothetical protein